MSKKLESSQKIDSARVPPEVCGWNWGAFWLGPIWAFGNRVFGGLFWWMVLVVGLIPVWIFLCCQHEADKLPPNISLVLACLSLLLTLSHFIFYPVAVLVLAARGNQRAWRHNRWRSIGEFQMIQRRWAIAGWLLGIPVTVFNFLAICGFSLIFLTVYVAPYMR